MIKSNHQYLSVISLLPNERDDLLGVRLDKYLRSLSYTEITHPPLKNSKGGFGFQLSIEEDTFDLLIYDLGNNTFRPVI